jgi:hypothetical protein
VQTAPDPFFLSITRVRAYFRNLARHDPRAYGLDMLCGGWARTLWIAGITASMTSLGCASAFGNKDARGEPLGTFHVDAKEMANSCGEGALGASTAWSFEVKLSRVDQSLLWNNGQEIITGSLAADESFAFTSEVLMNMRTDTSAHGLPACSIDRSDAAKGSLQGSASVTGLSGTLSYAFQPTSGSSCDDLLAAPTATFAALPCTMTFAITGARSGD